MLVWVAILFSRGSSQPRYGTQVSHIAGRFFTVWATSTIFEIVYLNVRLLQYTGCIIENNDYFVIHLVTTLLSQYCLLDGSVWYPKIIVKLDWVTGSGFNLVNSPPLTTQFLEYCFDRISSLLWSDIPATCITVGITSNNDVMPEIAHERE